MQLPIFNHKIYGNETAVYCRVKNVLFVNFKNIITDLHQENAWDEKSFKYYI